MRPAAVLVALVLSATLAAAARAEVPDSTRVTYVAGGSIYVNAGEAHGLRVGDTLEVVREASRIARLRVAVLSARRASCDTLDVERAPAIGDRVRGPWRAGGTQTAPPLTAKAEESAPGDSAPALGNALTTPAVPGARSRRWLRGRAGLRWFSSVSSAGTRLDRPMLDLHMDGTRARGAGDVAIDFRAHRSSLSGPGQDRAEAHGRLYRASFGFGRAGGEGPGFVVGRQGGVGGGAVGLFDGLTMTWSAGRWRAGTYGGSEPEPLEMRFSSDVVHAGAFVEVREQSGLERFWNARLGYGTSYDHTHPNRDYAFVQGLWRDGSTLVLLQQEADFLRAWKRRMGSQVFTPSNTFVIASREVTPWLDLRSGYDTRRSVRLWRDRETPETEFDDRFRQGAWIGATAGRRELRVSGELRGANGSGQSDLSWNGGLSWAPRLAMAPVARIRYASFRGGDAESRLASITVGLDPPSGIHVEGSGGRRSYDDGFGSTDSASWVEGVLEWSFAARWFAHASWTTEGSNPDRMTQTLAGISLRL